MEETDVVRALGALAQTVRLRVFRALVVAGPGGLTPGVLMETLDVAAATLSFHLKELVHAGLVGQQRDGRRLIYRVAFDRVDELLSHLTAHCCAGPVCPQASVPVAAAAPRGDRRASPSPRPAARKHRVAT
jgi:ArsR family transcriptional regulator